MARGRWPAQLSSASKSLVSRRGTANQARPRCEVASGSTKGRPLWGAGRELVVVGHRLLRGGDLAREAAAQEAVAIQVRCRGYSAAEDQWVAAADISDDLIAAYEREEQTGLLRQRRRGRRRHLAQRAIERVPSVGAAGTAQEASPRSEERTGQAHGVLPVAPPTQPALPREPRRSQRKKRKPQHLRRVAKARRAKKEIPAALRHGLLVVSLVVNA